ncbi:hypothetical protein ACTHS0_12055, partial [Neisseria sp. P0013.S009]|uniref:hypothetical protein n=1 Tax=Neisseria sp. P0013.S009 TaxID=3436745 RepID=UPI003F816D60
LRRQLQMCIRDLEKSVDYRTLDDPTFALCCLWRAMLYSTDRFSQLFLGRHNFCEDNASRIASSPPHSNFAAMLAYAYRSKVNYFSGKKGAERYGYIGP